MVLPKISIITPSYNQAEYLEETIRSVLDQQYENLEYIIIDGGSTDDSVKIIKEYQDHISYWISERDNGQSHALNKGFAKVTGDIIGWLNADDYYYHGTFSDVVDTFQKNINTGVVYGDFDWVDKHGKLIAHRYEIDFDINILLYTFCYIPTAASFFRRDILGKIGFVDENLHYEMDTDLFIRLKLYGTRFTHIKRLLSAYRWHERSKSFNFAKVQKLERHEILTNDRYPNLAIPQKRIIFLFKILYYRTLRWIKKVMIGAYTKKKSLLFYRPYKNRIL